MARIGYTKCGCCGQPEAAVAETGTGTLSVTCHRCQFSGYAKPGTRAARLIREAMTPDDDAPAPTPAPAPAATPVPAPVPPAKAPRVRVPFSLGSL